MLRPLLSAVVGAAAGLSFVPPSRYPAPDIHTLTECAQTFRVADLAGYMTATPTDCVLPVASLGLPVLPLLVGGALGAGLGFVATRWRRRKPATEVSPALSDPVEAYRLARDSFENIAHQIEADRARQWVIMPAQADAYWLAHAGLRQALAHLAAADPRAAAAAATDLLWRRPELSSILPPPLRQVEHPTIERLARRALIRFGAAVVATRLRHTDAVILLYTAAVTFIAAVTWPQPALAVLWTIAAAGLAGLAKLLSALTRRLHP